MLLNRVSEKYRAAVSAAIEGVSSHEEVIELPSEVIKESQISEFASIIRLMFPESDIVPSSYSYTVTADGYVSKLIISDYGKTPSEYSSEKSAVDSKVAELVKKANSNFSTEFEKAVFFHDYLVLNCTYTTGAENAHSAYGCLVDKEAVCEGYAKSFLMLCSKAGIECVLVTGEARSTNGVEPHMWNLVKLDGVWTHVDVTWDDNGRDYSSYTYFGLTDNEIDFSHTMESLTIYSVAPATSTSANYYIRTGKMLTNEANLVSLLTDTINSAAESGEKLVTIRCNNKTMFESVSDKMSNDSYRMVFDIIRDAKNNINSCLNATSISPLQSDRLDELNIISIVLKYE